mgnify:CR=1 FL=1
MRYANQLRRVPVHAVHAHQPRVHPLHVNLKTEIMALGKSISFIRDFIGDRELRRECNRYSKEELFAKFDFNQIEFEDAINMQLVKCQSHEEAERIHQIKFWFDVL